MNNFQLITHVLVRRAYIMGLFPSYMDFRLPPIY